MGPSISYPVALFGGCWIPAPIELNPFPYPGQSAASWACTTEQAGQAYKYLSQPKYNSPLAPYSAVIAEAGTANDVDPRFLIALSGAESTYGKFLNPSFGPFNAWNWGTRGFPGFGSGAETVAQGIAGPTYMGGGKTTLQSIYYGTYCNPDDPKSTCEAGLGNLQKIISQQKGDPTNLRSICHE